MRAAAWLATAGLVSMAMVGAATAKEDAPKTEKVTIGPASYQVPTAWERQRRANEMRVAQFGIPLAKGDEGKAELIVFYFGGQGGGVEENIARWVGMFETKDGEEKVESFKSGPLKVTVLDVSGDYKDKPFPMAQNFKLRKGYRMMAAVVETPEDGPYFFRMVGPKKSIAAQSEAFLNMLKTASVDG